MPRLPVISGADAVKAFTKAGWKVDRQKGSHVILIKSNCNVSLSIPQHSELAPGTIRSLIRSSRMTVEEFIQYL